MVAPELSVSCRRKWDGCQRQDQALPAGGLGTAGSRGASPSPELLPGGWPGWSCRQYGAGLEQEHRAFGGTVGRACLPSAKGLRLHTVSAAQCPPCSTGRGAPNCGNLPPSPAVPPARPPSTLSGARVGLATGQEVADAC